MKPEISESQFAMGANMALENRRWRYPLISPARIPTQPEEEHAGFDMEAEIKSDTGIEPLFVQYKRSEYMVGNARYNEHFSDDYYRFRITNAKQHNILTRIAEYNLHTYYVAPLFHTFEEYRDYHERGAVLDNAVFATSKGLPGMDSSDESDKHTIAFTPSRTVFFSEPTEIRSYIGLENLFLELTEEDSAFSTFDEIQAVFGQLVSDLNNLVNADFTLPELNESPYEWLIDVQTQFHTFGIDLCFVVDSDVE